MEMPTKPGFWQRAKAYILPVLFMAAFFAFTTYLVISKLAPAAKQTQTTVNDLKNLLVANQQISKDAAEALNKKPPEHSNTGLTAKTINKNGAERTIVSEGAISQANIDYLNQLAAQQNSITTPLELSINDTTGRYGNMINPLRSYFASSLLWSRKELPSLHQIRLVNAGASGWAGMYNGSYSTSGGRISSVTSWIDLNVYYYDGSPYILEYLEMALSHEYGHHFTLYNKWLTYNLPFTMRFPDGYYQTRPLSYATTTADYSKGWANCDAEILAEDYKYLFSPFKTQAMASSYGYPSDPATRNWVLSFGQVSTSADTIPPTVSITAPAAGSILSATAQFQAQASDNISVARVEFDLNNQSVGDASKSGDGWILSYNTLSQANDQYSLKARAFDQAGNTADSGSVNINISNSASDTTPPTISITSPANNQTLSGTFTFSVNATDNVKVQKVQFFVDNNLIQEKTLSPYGVNVDSTLYPNGQHKLKAVASDGQNSASKEIAVNIQNSAVEDTQNPTVQITAPSTSPFSWESGDLIITALGSDNVGVVKMEFYINNTLAATENSSSISRRWLSRGTPAGTYTLKAKAYDLVGNTGEAQVEISKK